MIPKRETVRGVCASATNGATRLRAKATASPIRRMGTSLGMAGGSLADDGGSQELAALVEHGLFDDLISAKQERLRDRQAERLGGLEVDDQIKFRGLLHRQVSRLRALEDLVDVPS